MKGFTPEELAELAAFDAEVDAEFELTLEELADARKRDAEAMLERKDRKARSIAEKQRAYYEANKDSIAEKQRAIKDARRAHGYTQREIAKLLGIAQPTLSRWETGAVPANWSLLVGVLPELREAAR